MAVGSLARTTDMNLSNNAVNRLIYRMLLIICLYLASAIKSSPIRLLERQWLIILCVVHVV